MTTLNLDSETLAKLKWVTNNDSENCFSFLGFSLNLQTGDLQDLLQEKTDSPKLKDPTMYQQIAELLLKYALAGKQSLTGKLVKFRLSRRIRLRECFSPKNCRADWQTVWTHPSRTH